MANPWAQREGGFNNRTHDAELTKHSYDSLRDRNLRHFYENPRVQRQLIGKGLIDKEGHIINVDKCKSQVAIIEQEFKNAERAETVRQKAQQEVQREISVRKKKAIDEARRNERIMRLKEEERIRRQIIKAQQAQYQSYSPSRSTD